VFVGTTTGRISLAPAAYEHNVVLCGFVPGP
jgi:hypothetical protein